MRRLGSPRVDAYVGHKIVVAFLLCLHCPGHGFGYTVGEDENLLFLSNEKVRHGRDSVGPIMIPPPPAPQGARQWIPVGMGGRVALRPERLQTTPK